ncbi:MAG: serine hydrolase, partial [Cyanobacteria bacterium P01_H01_bin.130]
MAGNDRSGNERAGNDWSAQGAPMPGASTSAGRSPRSQSSTQIPPFSAQSSAGLPRSLPQNLSQNLPQSLPPAPIPGSPRAVSPDPPLPPRHPQRRSLPVKRKLTLLQKLVLGLESLVVAIAAKLPDSAAPKSRSRQQRPSVSPPPDPRDQQPFGRFPLSQGSQVPDATARRSLPPPRYTPLPDPFATPPTPEPTTPDPTTPDPSDRRRSRQGATTPLWLQAVRTGIVGIGLGAIVGTVMLAIDPATRQTATPSSSNLPLTPGEIDPSGIPDTVQTSANGTIPAANPFTKQSDALQKKVKAVVEKYKGLSARVAVVDLDTGDYAVWNDTVSSRAASTIKAPVLVAFFQEVDAGRTALDQPITLEKRLLTGEAGVLQYQEPGTQITALEVLNKMIVISDNAATNLAINHLGGAAKLNDRFRQWGLQETTIRTWLPDVGGTNTVTARDMALLFYRLHRGELVSLRSRDRLLAILRNTRNASLLKQGIGRGGTLAHKTGTLGSTLADVGLVDTPNGRRYAIAAIVHRPRNDGRAGQLIRE